VGMERVRIFPVEQVAAIDRRRRCARDRQRRLPAATAL
jgi:hypothetical protein